METNINKEKYKNATLYFVDKCNNQYLGKAKLNKLFYYLDFISYRDTKKSVTGDSYIRDRLGPVPNSLLTEVVPELKNEGKLDIKETEIVKDGETFISWSFSGLDKPDMSYFDRSEIELLENICKEFKPWTSDEMIEQTHFEAPWFYAKQNEEIDYKYAKDIDFFEKTH